MFNIWERLVAGKLTTKEAFQEIDKELKTANTKERRVLMELSERILDREVPMAARDTEAEKHFWATTKIGSEDE